MLFSPRPLAISLASLYSPGMLGTDGIPLFASGTTARARPWWWGEDAMNSRPSMQSVPVSAALFASALRRGWAGKLEDPDEWWSWRWSWWW